MNIRETILEFYRPGTRLYDIFMDHAGAVTARALDVAERLPHLSPDLAFIKQAAMLHDIGIVLTWAKRLECRGDAPYVCHGVLGRKLLDDRGFHRHGLVCERHVGVGISKTDIRHQKLPLPLRDMRPISIEEQIICYADKFFSKNGNNRPKSIPAILDTLSSYGPDKGETFLAWAGRFEPSILEPVSNYPSAGKIRITSPASQK